MANKEDEVGIVRGLAWTSVGGDTLQIEVNVMPGEGEILLTGQLGDVMKESARTGISYIRSVSGEYGISENFLKEHDVHIHIPEGAVPKDGPYGNGNDLCNYRAKGKGRSGNDRGNYASRSSASDWRIKGEAFGS